MMEAENTSKTSVNFSYQIAWHKNPEDLMSFRLALTQNCLMYWYSVSNSGDMDVLASTEWIMFMLEKLHKNTYIYYRRNVYV